MRGRLILLLSAILFVTSVAVELPYEVLDSIIELNEMEGFKGLARVNVSDDRGPTRPIYRLDLEPDYAAYYEIDTGSDYVLLSSGAKTQDYREVESGPDPRPTDVLIQRAHKNSQRCKKFYRLAPIGLTVCKNEKGTVVAATFNWTANIPEIDDWRQLDGMVEGSIGFFKQQWQDRAAKVQSALEWKTIDVHQKGEKKKKKPDEEALLPGSIVKIALGNDFKTVNVYVRYYGNARLHPVRSKWQKKLCKVLVDICQDGGSKVNPSAVRKTPNELYFLKLEVHENQTFVRNVLQGQEIGFEVRIEGGKNEVITKYYAIDLRPKRSRRSSGWDSEVSICKEDEFPDYEQHKCCGGCWSGCSPVAWAQIFGYFDRVAQYVTPRVIISQRIYKDEATDAPKNMTCRVEIFVEDIRPQVGTFCNDGSGATYGSKMRNIAPWFRARQVSNSRVTSYLEKRKRRSAGGSFVEMGGRSEIVSKGVDKLSKGYPVIFSITMANNSGHSVVATKYREKSKRIRQCEEKATVCSWKEVTDYEFYLHFGWGVEYNGWKKIDPYAAHVAYLVK